MSKKNKKKKRDRVGPVTNIQIGCPTNISLEHLVKVKVKVGTHEKYLLVFGYLHALSNECPNWSVGGEPGGASDTYETEAVISSDNIHNLERFIADVVDKHQEESNGS